MTRWSLVRLQSTSGRPPPAASMAVGQFYNPKDGKNVFSPWWFVSTAFKKKVRLHCRIGSKFSVLLLLFRTLLGDEVSACSTLSLKAYAKTCSILMDVGIP